MSLAKCLPGRTYVVEKIDCAPSVKARLWQFGVTEGESVFVLRAFASGGAIITIDGAKIALGRDLCAKILMRTSEK